MERSSLLFLLVMPVNSSCAIDSNERNLEDERNSYHFGQNYETLLIVMVNLSMLYGITKKLRLTVKWRVCMGLTNS